EAEVVVLAERAGVARALLRGRAALLEVDLGDVEQDRVDLEQVAAGRGDAAQRERRRVGAGGDAGRRRRRRARAAERAAGQGERQRQRQADGAGGRGPSAGERWATDSHLALRP